jgi:hypothetical protein
MARNCLLTKPANHDILVVSGYNTRGLLILPSQRKKHYPHLVNIAPCRSATDESPANWPDNRWQRSYTGLSFLPLKSSAPDTCANTCQRLTIRNGGPSPMATNQNSTTPQDSQNSPEHICAKAPSHDPMTEIARLWPHLSARSQRCVVALALGLLILDAPEVRAWRGEA